MFTAIQHGAIVGLLAFGGLFHLHSKTLRNGEVIQIAVPTIQSYMTEDAEEIDDGADIDVCLTDLQALAVHPKARDKKLQAKLMADIDTLSSDDLLDQMYWVQQAIL